MSDLIERQAAIDACIRVRELRAYDEIEEIKALPSAQPDLPEWAQKVEEYRKSAPDMVHNPLAWALYQTWKEYDR